MSKRFIGLLKKDLMVAYRNYFFLAVIFVALLFAGIINFIIPEDATLKPVLYYYVDYDGKLKDAFDGVISKAEEEHSNIYRADSKEEIVGKMKKNINSIGMVVREVKGKPTIEFIMQGYENEKVINTLVLSMRDELNTGIREPVDIETLLLKEEVHGERIPLNKNVLPVFLVMEPTMLGFVLVSALIFMEKDEGTIRAYNVSPGRIWEYLASKIILMLILGWISTIISSVLVVGFNADYLRLIALVTVGSIFSTALGLIVASFFDNLSQSMMWVIIINLLLGLPLISYFVPSFAPVYIRLMPTYPLLFAIREAVFPTGNLRVISSTIVTFVVLSIINCIIALYAYKRNLVKG